MHNRSSFGEKVSNPYKNWSSYDLLESAELRSQGAVRALLTLLEAYYFLLPEPILSSRVNNYSAPRADPSRTDYNEQDFVTELRNSHGLGREKKTAACNTIDRALALNKMTQGQSPINPEVTQALDVIKNLIEEIEEICDTEMFTLLDAVESGAG